MIIQIGTIKGYNVDNIFRAGYFLVESETYEGIIYIHIGGNTISIVVGNIFNLNQDKINNTLFQCFNYIPTNNNYWTYNKIENLDFDKLMDLFYKEDYNEIQIMLRQHKIEKLKDKINI